MARATQKLSAKAIQHKRKPGYYADGGGLYLQVSASGSKSWIFRYMLQGKAREMGLGSIMAVSLAQARTEVGAWRKVLQDQMDPIAVRRDENKRKALERARSVSFMQCTREFIESHKAAWKNEKHATQWLNSLTNYCETVFKNLSVRDIDTPLVLKVVEPIWSTKAETATRLRGRIERVLDYGRVKGYRDGENPARWRGHLDQILANVPKTARVKHMRALPFVDMGEFMEKLREREAPAARALEFLILTATRTADVRGCTAAEFNDDFSVWTIPGIRRKGKRGAKVDLRIPLSRRAQVIAKEQVKQHGGMPFMFPGERETGDMSENAMLEVLDRMGYQNKATVHGFRSTFRDWSAECTNYSNEMCEMALGHAINNQAEAAYRRGDLFERRRKLMDAWATYCANPQKAGTVTSIGKSKKM
jgi:integrase